MNFLFKILLLLAFSIYGFATCTTPETNASNSLRLAHNICPKLFINDESIKETTVVNFYRNDHRGTAAAQIGYPISITIDGIMIAQPWVETLTKTVNYLKGKIIDRMDGNYTVVAAAGKLTLTAKQSGYHVDIIATGGTRIGRSYNSDINGTVTEVENIRGSADINMTGPASDRNFSDGSYSGIYGDGYDPRVEVKRFDLSLVKFNDAPITGIFFQVNGQTQINEKGIASISTMAQLVAKLDNPTIASVVGGADDNLTVTNSVGGYANDTILRLDYNSTATDKNVTNITIPGKIILHGKPGKPSKRKVYYYGNQGIYSMEFFKGNNWDGNDSNGTSYRTPYLGTMSATLNKLANDIGADGNYTALATAVATPLGSNFGYITISRKDPITGLPRYREHDYNVSGRSGDGNASVTITTQGLADAIDINMTSIIYNHDFLYTTFKVDYDVNETAVGYEDAQQDILEIFEVYHRNDDRVSIVNTIDLESVEILRQDDNITSVVSVNNIVFVGDSNSSYYTFNRVNPQLKNKDLKFEMKLEEPNEIRNVNINMAEYYQDGTDGYVFVADNSTLRVYKVNSTQKVTTYSRYNFSGEISGMVRDGQYLYVQSDEDNKLTKFTILTENNKFSIERTTQTFTLNADKIYVRGKYIYYTAGSDAPTDDIGKGYGGELNQTANSFSISGSRRIDNNQVSFMIGDELYSASIGMDGLKIYDKNDSLNSADGKFSGSQILVLGEFIITDDLNSSQIRIYKFGDVSVSSREGEGSPAKPFNLKMMANKINMDDVAWTIEENGKPESKMRLRHKRPTYPFTKTGLWFVEATVSYKNYHLDSKYRYLINVMSDNAPNVEISASHNNGEISTSYITGLKEFKVDFNSTITKDSYVDSIKWDFNDTNDDGSNAESFLKNPSWIYKKKGDYNATLTVYYDQDKNVTKIIIVHVSEPLEMNTTNVDGNNTVTHIKGDDINFSIDILGNDDFSFYDSTAFGGAGGRVSHQIKSYIWYFGDGAGGADSVSYLAKPIFVYDRIGDYTITAEIIRRKDESRSMEERKFIVKKTISVVDFNKPAIIADKLSGESPLKVNFSIDLKGYLIKNNRPESIEWQFTNGEISAKQNPTYTFKTDPLVTKTTYNVIATIQLSQGGPLVLEKQIVVNNEVDLEIEATALEGYSPLTVNLVATGSSFEGINRYEWMIGLKGEEKVKKTGTSLEHTFDSNGTYEINATAFSNKDHNGTANLVIKVEKGPDVMIKGELVSLTDLTNYKFTAIKEVGDTSVADENTSWLINDVEVATKTLTMTYKFLESKAYKIEFRVVLSGGNIVKYVYDRNPSFNPYVKKVQLYTGWNLMSSPLDERFIMLAANGDPVPQQATNSLQRLRDISSVIWTFTNNTWQKDPSTIPARSGFWIKTTVNKELIFDGNTNYEPDLTTLTSGNWYLFGTGKKLENYKANNGSLSIVWAYKKGKWYKNPSMVDVGDGLWVKAN